MLTLILTLKLTSAQVCFKNLYPPPLIMENLELIDRPKVESVATTPDQLLALAVNKNLDIDKLAKLMDLQREYNADLARKAFFHALTEFQYSVPEIRKNKKVGFDSKDGSSSVEYSYAPLADIIRQIKEVIKKSNLSYRWEIQDDKDVIHVTCIITHSDGHSEKTSMTSSPDTSGKKNSIQARGSAIEYMKRYTLIGALGLSTADTDIDARNAEYEYDVDKLHNQFMEIYDKIIQIDSSKSAWHPDNWVLERTGKNYVKALGDARKVLTQLTVKPKR